MGAAQNVAAQATTPPDSAPDVLQGGEASGGKPGGTTAVPAGTTAVPAGTDGGRARPTATSSAAQNNAKRIAPKPALAQDIAQPLALLLSQIDSAKKAIERLKHDDERLAKQRALLTAIPAKAASLRDTIAPRLTEIVALSSKLGPAPKKGEPAETATLAATRTKLTQRRTILESAIKETQLIETRAQQLIADIQVKRQKLFTDNLFARTNTPLSAAYWDELASEWSLTSRQLSRILGDWFDQAQVNGFALAALLLLALGLGVYMWRLAKDMIWARLASEDNARIDFVQRGKLIAWILPTRLLPYGLALAITVVGLSLFGMLSAPVGTIVLALIKAISLVIFISALSRTVLAPRHPQWRLVKLATPTVTRIYILLVAIAGVYGLDIILSEAAGVLFQPITVRILGTFATSSLLAFLFIAIALTPFDTLEDAGADAGAPNQPALGEQTAPGHPVLQDHRQSQQGLEQAGSAMPAPPGTPIMNMAALQVLITRGVLLTLAAGILLTTLTGYVALGGFIARQVVVTGSIFAIGILTHLAIAAYARELASSGAAAVSQVGFRRKITAPQNKTILRALVFLLNIVLVIALAPWLLLQWGFNGADLVDGVKTSLFGFEIGGVQISIARIIAGIALFAAIVFATKLLQGWLSGAMSARASIDPGVANSIRAVVGYTGMTIAALSAVSYAGFDISKFAIVAGALSVGIGFGLQSIVNNFVSGLILLAERPIKVGDWIVVGTEQGHVRRISVRATEIETFDKASVIIPNSELIAGQVINWTHRNKLGRAVVAVGVGYHCDPEQVRELLLEIGAAHPKAMKFPAPVVHFDNLGASSLDFSLRVYIADINSRATVRTDLRMAIMKKFKQHNIEIPFQQHDIHLRDLDGVKQVLSQVIAERNRARAEPLHNGEGEAAKNPGKDSGGIKDKKRR